MSDSELTTIQVGEPEFRNIEGKFTIESRGCLGGDWAKNIGGENKEKRVTFDGCMTGELYAAIIDAIAKVVDA
jgi:hypothetical protein